MVKHIVLWKVKDSAEKQQNIERMTTMLNALVGKIEGLVSVELGYNFNTSSDYDVVLYATLKSASALRRYQNHPEHVKCKDFIGSITESRVAADYFYDEETAAAPPYIEDEDIPAETQAAPEPEAPKGPEITVEFPPKREILPAPSIPKAAPVSAPADSAAFSEDKLYDPAFAPEIVVRRPPLWEAEVIPAKNGTIAVTRAADEKTAPVDPFAAESSFAEPVSLFADEPASKPAPKKKFPSPAPKAAPTRTAATPKATPANAQVNPVSTEHSKITEKTNAFGKKKLDVQVTPLDQRSDTWTCPNCGKIMPNYVGTCGCGEPKPFEFEPPMPSDAPAAPAPKAAPTRTAATPKATPANAQVNPVSTEHSKITEKTNAFGKKKLDVQVTPLDQRSDTWTCPNCGKIMPNYVGTCGCGEPKPFEFEPPMPSDAPAAPAPKAAPTRTAATPKATPANAQVNPVSTEHSKITEKTNAFGKKKLDVQVTPLDQRSDTWTCPNCGKIMPNYVGTCGCGEPKPFEFEPPMPSDAPAAPAPKAAPTRTAATPKATPANAQVNPVSTEHSKITEKTNAFGKKKLDVQVTPLDQRSDTWTCPNCGKIMPNYVGTCGCGEPKPFEFEPPMPSDAPAAPAPKAAPTRTAATPKATPANAQVNPVSTEHSKITEKTNAFGKKKLDVQVTPLDQRSDTWTCPNCGKIMPNYVGTCGCGEPKPFEFEPPMPSDAPAAPAPKAAPTRTAATPKATPANAQVNPVSTEHSKITEKTNAFGKKKLDVQVTPLDQRSDTWTCPNCGKIMPNYVGTCGCGEPKPFEFEPPMPSDAPAAPAPKAAPTRTAATPKATPANAQVNPVSTEHSKITEKTNAFGKKKLDVQVTPLDQRSDTWTCPNCGKIMPNYVGTCGCGEPKPFEFEPPMPSDAPAAPAPKAAPTRTAATPKATPANAQVNPVSTEHSKITEKTNAFGKKKLDVQVTPLDQRSDTWTCPNCGKIMPNYVGTCGCGEPKPFEFEPPMPFDADTAPLPDIKPAEKPKSKLSKEQMDTFENVGNT